MNTNSNYPLEYTQQTTSDYREYQQPSLPLQYYPQQPMTYPPQTPIPQQAPMQPMYSHQPMVYPQQMPMGMPYPQQPMMYPQQQPMMYPQQMMPPQPINVIVHNNNVNHTIAAAGYVGNVRYRSQTSGMTRLIYFLCFGMFAGMCWLCIGLILCCTGVGASAGARMLGQVPAIMFLP